MRKRKVHKPQRSVSYIGHDKTLCGQVIYIGTDLVGFGSGFKRATCKTCLRLRDWRK